MEYSTIYVWRNGFIVKGSQGWITGEKKRALSHYRKANKKHFLLASGVTMMAFSTGMYTTQVAKADQTATTTQVQQQTAETTQATTEAKTDLTLTT